MKKFIFIVIIPLFLHSLELKIASYNVENLFDDVNNGTEYKEYIPGTHNWNKNTLSKKLVNITRVICDLNPDIIGLQEIENLNALKLLQTRLNRAGCKYPYSAITDKKGSAIEVALLSKVPIVHKKDIRVSYSKADRDILRIELKTEPRLTIFVNHWRSKKSPESQRVKYAKALMEAIKKLPKGSEYIILGDFNSEYNECSNLSQRNNDTNNTCGIDNVLHTYNNNVLIKFRDKNLTGVYHYNLWSELPPHKRWSHDYYGKKGAIDSIIIPPSLNDNKGWFYVKGSFNVFKKVYLFDKKNRVYRWVYKHSKHLGIGFSDHLPIYALFSNSKKRELKHESLADKFFKAILPAKENKIVTEATTVDFKELYLKNSFEYPVILKNVCVIFKRGDYGVLKSSPNSKALALYKSAEGLEEGRCYDLKVYKKSIYYKIKEITDLDILKKREKINVEEYIPEFNESLMERDIKNYGEIVKNIKGVYKYGYITVNNRSYKLYLKKKKRGILKKNSVLFIKKAQIGYYKGEKELIVYSLQDIEKLN